MGFHLDPWPHLAVVWLEKRAFLVSDLTSVCRHIVPFTRILHQLWIFFSCLFVNLIYFDQGRRSCPGVTCIHYTVVPGFRVLGFSTLPGFRALKAVDRPSALNPGTTVLNLEGQIKNSWKGRANAYRTHPTYMRHWQKTIANSRCSLYNQTAHLLDLLLVYHRKAWKFWGIPRHFRQETEEEEKFHPLVSPRSRPDGLKLWNGRRSLNTLEDLWPRIYLGNIKQGRNIRGSQKKQLESGS